MLHVRSCTARWSKPSHAMQSPLWKRLQLRTPLSLSWRCYRTVPRPSPLLWIHAIKNPNPPDESTRELNCLLCLKHNHTWLRGGGRDGGNGDHAGHVHEVLVFAVGVVATVLVLLGVAYFLTRMPVPNLVTFPSFPFHTSAYNDDVGAGMGPGLSGRTFFGHPKVSYIVDRCVTRWDARRIE